jgi:NADPH2:quinone reductase
LLFGHHFLPVFLTYFFYHYLCIFCFVFFSLYFFGAASGQVPPFDIQRLNRGGSLYLTRPSLAHYTATHDELTMRARRLFELIERGVLEVRIAETFPLTAVGEAQEVLAGRSVIGKLVIRID